MATVPTTSTTLLRDIAESSENARWGEFFTRYQPMMLAFLQSHFPSLDADDIVQETLIALTKVLPNYRYNENEKGHFHNYLIGILRKKALDELRKSNRVEKLKENAKVGCDDLIAPSEDPAMREWRQSIYEIVLQEFLSDESVNDITKQIVVRTSIDGESAKTVCEALGVTENVVDHARRRSIQRMKERVEELKNL